MPACPDSVLRLIEHFDRQADQVRSPDYNETMLRIDFVNPFFEALGWDMDNTQGFAEQYREVVHEDRVRVAGATKAPDYSFRIGGVRKFFLEAKKPFVNIKENWEPAYQLRRYAWSAKLAVSLLTDFEELAIYDCRIAPKQLERPSVARRDYMRHHEYPQRWEFLEGTFSKRAVLTGEFDRYCDTKKGRGAQEFDDAFLEEIEEWRKKLAANLALRNDTLNEQSLNFAVQRIIDRIIFLRICEDRGVEPTGNLQQLLNGEECYARLTKIFRDADDRYNSGLFHFRVEKGRDEAPDDLTPALEVDDAALKGILKRLYYPESPYEFSVVSADILGSVYERFLGSVIELTRARRVRIEPKPEVRKAGGVYYTPTYIVDYIVRQTVGRLLGDAVEPAQSEPEAPARSAVGSPRGAQECSHGREPVDRSDENSVAPEGRRNLLPSDAPVTRLKQSNIQNPESRIDTARVPMTPKEAARLKILDPACGSGSFLLGAYQYLLDWHLRWYVADGPEKWSQGKNATIRPADRPAVTDTPPTAAIQNPKSKIQNGQHWALTTRERKRILLDNIHGVDIDFQAVEVTKLSLLLKCLEGETAESLRAGFRLFHERALPDLGRNIQCGNSLIGTDIMQTDAWREMSEDERRRVNPFDYERAFPQVFKGRDSGFDAVIGNPPWGAEVSAPLLEHLLSRLTCATSRDPDTYSLFIERGFHLLKSNGALGFITPDTFLRKDGHLPLREMLLRHATLDVLCETGPLFSQVRDTWCAVFSVRRATPMDHHVIQQRKISRYVVSVEERLRLFEKQNWWDAQQTRQSVWRRRSDLVVGYLASEQHQTLIEKLERLPVLADLSDHFDISRGEEGSKYNVKEARKGEFRLVIPEDVERFHVKRGTLVDLATLTPGKVTTIYRRPKLWLIRIQKMRWKQRLVVGADFRRNSAGMKTLQSFTARDDNLDLLRLLQGLLASRVMNFRCINYLADDMNRSYLLQLPVPQPNLKERSAAMIVETVEMMLRLNAQLAMVKQPDEIDRLRRQIEATDRQIDQLVYQLYNLTDAEIRLVEDATA